MMAKWIGSWHASQTQFAPQFFAFTFPHASFEQQTVRMVLHPHVSGSQLRLKFSNRYGMESLTIGKVVVARHLSDGKIVPQTDVAVHFHGNPQVTIPAGEERYSDPVVFTTTTQSDIAVSMYLPSYTKVSTWHWTPAQTTYVADGDQTKKYDTIQFTTNIDSYYWLTNLDVLTEEENTQVIVALGDSITEGFTATINANHRWPDFLQERFHREYPDLHLSVLNAGITGNLITIDGADVDLHVAGEKTLTRLHWDVFSQSGVTDVIFFQGINDIFGDADAKQIITGMKDVATRVHQQNIRIVIGTIIPFGHSDYYSEAKERVRQEVNTWIRSNELFDGVIDFDQALADPHTPNQILPAYDSGDHLHPNDEGFKALAHAVPLALFVR